MANDENTDLLLGLGLSLNQARVYLAILKLEKTTVGQVAKFSKVRREDVYRLLPSLEKMGLVERLLGKPTEVRAMPISDALSFLVAEEKSKSDERLTGMRSAVQRLSLKDWKQPLPGEASIYILIAEKKAILAKTSELISNSRKEVALIADKARIIPILSQFSDECTRAIKEGTQIRLIFEGDSSDSLLKEKVQKLIDGPSVHVKFYRGRLNHFIMSDDKEALITTSKETGLGESPSLWTNNGNLIGVLRTGFESDWERARYTMNSDQKLSLVVCECGFKIPLVPDLDEMARSIEAHTATHDKSETDPEKAEAERNRIEELLTQKVLTSIGKKNHNKH
jgi:sugar-specific transcriptional regulator TrmB